MLAGRRGGKDSRGKSRGAVGVVEESFEPVCFGNEDKA